MNKEDNKKLTLKKEDWNDLLNREEIKNISFLEKKIKCPYLSKIQGSSFHYCQILSEKYYFEKNLPYSKTPSKKCVEYEAKVSYTELEQHCLSSNYHYCEIYEKYKKEMDNLELPII